MLVDGFGDLQYFIVVSILFFYVFNVFLYVALDRHGRTKSQSKLYSNDLYNSTSMTYDLPKALQFTSLKSIMTAECVLSRGPHLAGKALWVERCQRAH